MNMQHTQKSGLNRSASLLHALGAKAAPVWAALDPSDAAKLTQAMETGTLQQDDAEAAAGALLSEVARTAHRQTPVWTALSNLSAAQLTTLLAHEHPQVIALALTHMAAPAAAAFIRQLPQPNATDILQRMVHMAPAHTAALTAIETKLGAQLTTLTHSQKTRPEATVARLFDALPAETGETLLNALHTVEPDAGERVRALMFTFSDLADLSPAGMQTLLSRTPRETLTLALKGVSGPVADVFYKNMTQRAGNLLREEMTALGAQPRKEVEAARAALVSLARNLIDSGDIRPASDVHDEDFIL